MARVKFAFVVAVLMAAVLRAAMGSDAASERPQECVLGTTDKDWTKIKTIVTRKCQDSLDGPVEEYLANEQQRHRYVAMLNQLAVGVFKQRSVCGNEMFIQALLSFPCQRRVRAKLVEIAFAVSDRGVPLFTKLLDGLSYLLRMDTDPQWEGASVTLFVVQMLQKLAKDVRGLKSEVEMYREIRKRSRLRSAVRAFTPPILRFKNAEAKEDEEAWLEQYTEITNAISNYDFRNLYDGFETSRFVFPSHFSQADTYKSLNANQGPRVLKEMFRTDFAAQRESSMRDYHNKFISRVQIQATGIEALMRMGAPVHPAGGVELGMFFRETNVIGHKTMPYPKLKSRPMTWTVKTNYLPVEDQPEIGSVDKVMRATVPGYKALSGDQISSTQQALFEQTPVFLAQYDDVSHSYKPLYADIRSFQRHCASADAGVAYLNVRRVLQARQACAMTARLHVMMQPVPVPQWEVVEFCPSADGDKDSERLAGALVATCIFAAHQHRIRIQMYETDVADWSDLFAH